jgi:hypothetical protein
MRVTFGFRRRHHRRKQLPNRAGMNVLPNRRRMMDGLHRNVIDRAQYGHQHEQDLIRLTPHCQIPAALLSSTRAIPAANVEGQHEHL